MRTAHLLRLLVLLALAFAVGCSSTNKGKIEGTSWRSDRDTYKGKTFQAGYLKLELQRDGKLVYRIGNQTFAGKYTLGPSDQVIFHLDRELGGSKVHSQKVLVHGDRMAVLDGDGTEMRFQRE